MEVLQFVAESIPRISARTTTTAKAALFTNDDLDRGRWESIKHACSNNTI